MSLELSVANSFLLFRFFADRSSSWKQKKVDFLCFQREPNNTVRNRLIIEIFNFYKNPQEFSINMHTTKKFSRVLFHSFAFNSYEQRAMTSSMTTSKFSRRCERTKFSGSNHNEKNGSVWSKRIWEFRWRILRLENFSSFVIFIIFQNIEKFLALSVFQSQKKLFKIKLEIFVCYSKKKRKKKNPMHQSDENLSSVRRETFRP